MQLTQVRTSDRRSGQRPTGTRGRKNVGLLPRWTYILPASENTRSPTFRAHVVIYKHGRRPISTPNLASLYSSAEEASGSRTMSGLPLRANVYITHSSFTAHTKILKSRNRTILRNNIEMTGLRDEHRPVYQIAICPNTTSPTKFSQIAPWNWPSSGAGESPTGRRSCVATALRVSSVERGSDEKPI